MHTQSSVSDPPSPDNINRRSTYEDEEVDDNIPIPTNPYLMSEDEYKTVFRN